MLKLDFFNKTKEGISSKIFERAILAAEKIIGDKISHGTGFKDASIGLIFIGDEEMHGMNFSHRNMDKPTDVLSFSYLEKAQFPYELGIDEFMDSVGEVFISVDTAKRQAKEQKHSFEEEIITLFIHGLLHVFGYDHERSLAEEKLTEKLTLEIKKEYDKISRAGK
ncbi:MAG: metalloprotein, probable rRNA maturation factor [Candidatus Peregrinibacteria bacterium GW2011_GWF2_38_29]|nr:MAG: metalloprotein, probable rRNA maturation factor [Candidatus Peregrinibacteria bacterium GW2011_GWF2_38_29]HBB03045.1 rRNA maturation RNase YbeY [Candidatus Peregrinibacteria bacterium]